MSAAEGRWDVVETTGVLPPADRRSAFANAPMGVALTTTAGVLVDVNPALCAMLGWTADELHGRSVLDLAHPDAAATAREAHAGLSARRDRPMRIEIRLVRADGADVP